MTDKNCILERKTGTMYELERKWKKTGSFFSILSILYLFILLLILPVATVAEKEPLIMRPLIVCQPDRILTRLTPREESVHLNVLRCDGLGINCKVKCVFQNVTPTERLQCNLVNVTSVTMLRTFKTKLTTQQAEESSVVTVMGPVFSYYMCPLYELGALNVNTESFKDTVLLEIMVPSSWHLIANMKGLVVKIHYSTISLNKNSTEEPKIAAKSVPNKDKMVMKVTGLQSYTMYKFVLDVVSPHDPQGIAFEKQTIKLRTSSAVPGVVQDLHGRVERVDWRTVAVVLQWTPVAEDINGVFESYEVLVNDLTHKLEYTRVTLQDVMATTYKIEKLHANISYEAAIRVKNHDYTGPYTKIALGPYPVEDLARTTHQKTWYPLGVSFMAVLCVLLLCTLCIAWKNRSGGGSSPIVLSLIPENDGDQRYDTVQENDNYWPSKADGQ